MKSLKHTVESLIHLVGRGAFGESWLKVFRTLSLQTPPGISVALGAVGRCCGAVAGGLLDLFYPPSCVVCSSPRLTLPDLEWCRACIERMPWVRAPMCPLCGRPFPKSPSSRDHLCGECLLDTFHFDAARSSFYHVGFVRDALHAVKFGAQLHFVRPLSQILAHTALRWDGLAVDRVVPVPLHPRRLRERGFNQSALMAGFLAGKIGVPMDLNILKRRSWTAPQTRLGREERLKNVRDAFVVHDGVRLRGRSVLLVDDVFTTGTTLSECAKVLKENGAREVMALTVSRALPEKGILIASQ